MSFDPDRERRIVEDPFDDWPPRAPERQQTMPASTHDEEKPTEDPVIVPADVLSADTLTALIEEFVTRHGTELSDAGGKISQVRKQLEAGIVQIVFDPNTESCNIQEVGA